MQLAMDHFGLLNRDTVLIGGDTLFFSDFSFAKLLEDLTKMRSTQPECSAVLSYLTDDAGASKYGILEVASNQLVTAFLEKPGALRTSSRWACPCFYVLSPPALRLVKTFLDENASAPLSSRDAPGNFIRYLQDKVCLHSRGWS
jgi:UTP-glucose-1-phosphate uridylyltransferase